MKSWRSHDEELAQLRREVVLLRQERDILPSATGYFAAAPRLEPVFITTCIGRAGRRLVRVLAA